MSRAFEGSMVAAWRPGPATLRRAVEVTLVVLLAGQTARLIWATATPIGPLGEPVAVGGAPMAMPTDTSIMERFNPVGTAGPNLLVANAAPAATAPTAPSISLTLHGVRASMFGDGGSAIIAGPDGKQAAYRIGEQIEPGVVLRAIRRDHAVVTRDGAPVRLAFGAATPVPAQASAPVTASGGPVQPASAPAEAANGNASTAGGVPVPTSGVGAALLGQAGLQPGDTVTAVNGRPLNTPERQAELAEALSQGGDAEVRYVRNGITMTTRVRVGR